MTMRKLLLTTHWTASEVHDVLEFLAELQDVIKNNYVDELNDFYHEIATEEPQEDFDFVDDIITF